MKKYLLTAAFALSAMGAAAQDVTIKMGHAASSQHLFQDGLEMFAKKVAEKTDGAIAIEVFGDRQLGDDRQLLEGLQIGLIDGALVSSPTLPLVLGIQAFDVLQLPFVVQDYGQIAEVLGSDLGSELLARLDEKSIKGLGFVEGGQRHFLSRQPVTATADFAGLKTRIVPIPLHEATWRAVGVSPIGMAYGEVYSAIETGTIDAVEINLSSIRSESLHDAAKHATLTGHYFWPGVVMMSGRVWNGLSDAHKAALQEAAQETTAEAYAHAAAQEDDTRAYLEQNGVTITALSDLDRMLELTAPVVAEWLAKDPLIGKFLEAYSARQ